MAWREVGEIGVWRNEGGNGVEAYVAKASDKRIGSPYYAWNVRRHGRVLAYGYARSLETAQDESERRLIEAERAHTDEDDLKRRSGRGEHYIDPYDRQNGEHVKGHWAEKPRRR
jgi:hypothetical protein